MATPLSPLLPARKERFYLRVLLGAAVGVGLGLLFGAKPIAFGLSTEALSRVGLLVIRVLKVLATPLIFFAVLEAVLGNRIPKRKGLALLAISAVNAAVAVGIGLGVAHWCGGHGAFGGALQQPATSAASAPDRVVDNASRATLNPLTNLASYVPENLVDPFRHNNVISVVLLAVLFALALRTLENPNSAEPARDLTPVRALVKSGFNACVALLGWTLKLVPFAVAGVLAGVVGQRGLGVLGGLFAFLGTILLGLLLHGVVYYSLLILVLGKRHPLAFWRGAADAATMALSTGSSLATLPVTLSSLEKMRVSRSSARLAACVGTNLNHDGIILYEAAATVFIAQAAGIDLSLASQLGVAAAAVMAGVGVAGVPEAGLITLPLVLGTAGLPAGLTASVVPLILPVDWIIGRFRAATNVTSDMTVAVLLDRFFPASADELANTEAPDPALSPAHTLAQPADLSP